MLAKARFFKDNESAQSILKSRTPAHAKALSYSINNFNEKAWETVQSDIMMNVCR